MKEKPKIPITFIALMGSVIISQVGLSVYITALNWKVLEFSNSAFHTGVIATSMTLPQFLFSLAGGAIADNKEKLRSLRLIIVLQALVVFLFSLISLSLSFNFIVTYAIAFLLGTLSAIWQPIYLSYIPNLVHKSFVPLGMSLSLAGLYASRFLGPIIAGWLLKYYAPYTPFFVYFFSLLLPFLVMNIIKFPVSVVAPSTPNEKKTFQPSVLLQDKAIFSLWLINVALSLFMMSVFSIIPYFAKNIFGLDSTGMSRLMSSCGLGQLIGAGLSIAIGKRNEAGFGKNQFIGYALMGTFLLLFTVSSNMILAIIALLMMNVLHGVLSPRVNTVIQTYAPECMRGKIQSMFLLVFGFVPFGQFVLGLITTPTAPRVGAIVYVSLFFITLLFVLFKSDRLFHLQQENGSIHFRKDA
ncbi:MAG: MFS transporter [Anaerolineaceae bacterium]|jgi:MFS family permease